MKQFFIIVTLLAIYLSACTSNRDKNVTKKSVIKTTNSAIADFTKFYDGTINGNNEIIMTLTKKKDSLSGTYSYKRKKIPIKITGKIDELGNLIINEFNDNGNMTGVFKGRLDDVKIVGKWEKPDGSQMMPFSLSESEDKKNSIKNSTDNSDEYLNWSGSYTYKYGNILEINGPDNDGALNFELIQAKSNCTGQIEGTAYLTKRSVANYVAEGDNCHLNFTFNPGSIQVSEYNCEDYRGATCGPFDGWYYK